MPPRFSIWLVLAGVMAGVIAGYLAGSGVLGESPLARKKGLDPGKVRAEFSKGLGVEQRAEMLRAFDGAVRRAAKR